jgi:hypothetical protein
MSVPESALGDVLDRLVSDPRALAELVLVRLLKQAVGEEALASHAEEPPEELIASVLGDRLTRIFAPEDPPGEPADIAALVERDSALAAALGACDCWGQDSDCPTCGGAGGPGWAQPDALLFARHVQPAVRVAGRRATNMEREESEDGHQLAG